MGEFFVTGERRTPAFERAVEALQALEDAGTMDAACAEATRDYREQLYIKRRGVKLSPGLCILERLTGRRAVRDPVSFAWIDHRSLWLKDGKPYSFVTQPYGLSLNDLKQIVAYCEEHGLDVFVDAGLSWHYPGTTVAVEFTRRE